MGQIIAGFAGLLSAFASWIVVNVLPVIAAYYAGRSKEQTRETKQILETTKAQLAIANRPDASVDAVADWLSGGTGS